MRNATPSNQSHVKVNQVAAITDALTRVLPATSPADAVLKHFFRDHPGLGARDRSLIAETVYAVLRRRLLLEHLVTDGSPRKLALLGLTRLMGWSASQLSGVLAESELEWLAALKVGKDDESSSMPLSLQTDLPDWIVRRLQQTLDKDDIVSLGRSLQKSAPLDLRVNTLRLRREAVLEAFARDGIKAAPTPYSPWGVRLEEKIALNKHALFVNGSVEVQDEGSQLLGLLTEARRGEMVVDFCAGAGGKSLLLGAMMQSQGRLYAFDVSEKRLANLAPRLKRSGLSNLFPTRIDSENDAKVKRLAGKIDRVLVDAPCSGLGTLRRNPDLKTRQTEAGLAELNVKQSAILASAARLVKPGGRLVYATCSFLKEENESVTESFLARNPDFSVLDANEVLTRQQVDLKLPDQWFRMWPHLHQTDGFFAAVMVRKGANA